MVSQHQSNKGADDMEYKGCFDTVHGLIEDASKEFGAAFVVSPEKSERLAELARRSMRFLKRLIAPSLTQVSIWITKC